MRLLADGGITKSGDIVKAADAVSQLANEVASIDEVLAVIRSISEQTNLLALNAAIEAARIAIDYRTPVFLLSDGYIANGSEPWQIPAVADLPRIDPNFATGPNHKIRKGAVALAARHFRVALRLGQQRTPIRQMLDQLFFGGVFQDLPDQCDVFV